jgi:hypothetical protein
VQQKGQNDAKATAGAHVDDEGSSTTEYAADAPECLICCEKIQYYAVGECNHAEVCALCSVRMRLLYDDRDCCMCKKALDRVYVAKTKLEKQTHNGGASEAAVAVEEEEGKRRTQASFEELEAMVKADPQLQKNHLDLTLPGGSGGGNMYFLDTAYYTEVRHLFDVECEVCRHKFSSVHSLRQHAEQVHGELYCDLCLKHRKVFLYEQVRYPSHGALARHIENGDAERKLKPHPWFAFAFAFTFCCCC